MTQIEAPILMTVAEERLRIPANSEVISIIRNTAKRDPDQQRCIFRPVVDQELVGDL